MKRALLSNVRVIPAAENVAIDRSGILSAIVAANVTDIAGGNTIKFEILTSDTADGTFEKVLDERLFLDNTKEEKDGEGKVVGYYAEATVAADEVLNLDIDLLGCKQFIQVKVTSAATAVYAVALGDSNIMPV